ncbi:hypothetical protein HN51_048994 [Arachis hypogaea]
MEVQNNATVVTTVKFTWTINNYYKLISIEKRYSQTFFVGLHPWRIVISPEFDDNNVKKEKYEDDLFELEEEECEDLSIYFAALDSANLPDDWFPIPTFKL